MQGSSYYLLISPEGDSASGSLGEEITAGAMVVLRMTSAVGLVTRCMAASSRLTSSWMDAL